MYGCYRCGKIEGEVRYDEVIESYCCEECGAIDSLVTFEQALDIINDAYLTFGHHYDGIDEEELSEAIWNEEE